MTDGCVNFDLCVCVCVSVCVCVCVCVCEYKVEDIMKKTFSCFISTDLYKIG